jgi:predicted RNA-binding protein YlxR (DUF448 family)
MVGARQRRHVRHVPLRRCVVCRHSRPQAELLRFYQDEAARWRLDAARKAGGRGAWLCADSPNCHETKALKRFFKQQAESVHEQLGQEVTALERRLEPGGMNAG